MNTSSMRNPECARLEAILRKKTGGIANLFRTSKGRKKDEVLKNATRFAGFGVEE